MTFSAAASPTSVAAVDGSPVDGRSRASTARASLFAAGVAGPVAFLVGQGLLPVLPEVIGPAFDGMVEHRGQLMAARILTYVGAFLLTFAALAYPRLVPRGRPGSRLLLVGAVVFAVASFSNALSQAVSGYAAWVVTTAQVDPDAGRYVVEHVESGLVALPLGFWSIPAFALGALVMAAGLARSRRSPRWLAPLLAVGVVLGAAFAGRGFVVLLTQLPMTVALVAMAGLARTPDAQ